MSPKKPASNNIMPRGVGYQHRVCYKGEFEEFIVIASDINLVKKFRTDKTIPLFDIVDKFSIFISEHGHQGILNKPSQSTLDNEFGTHRIEDCIKIVLEKGVVDEHKVGERPSDRNITKGPTNPH